MSPPPTSFADLTALATHLRDELGRKRFILLYAHNGTGKTRLSTAFKDLGKQGDERDTLYFNAFTEDLFNWDNDLKNDRERVLKINKDSRFFAGLEQMEMDNRIRPLLGRYADFDFKIDTDAWEVTFSREVVSGATTATVDDIKVSRGEENIFIWCFFLAVVQLVLDGPVQVGEVHLHRRPDLVLDGTRNYRRQSSLAAAPEVGQRAPNCDLVPPHAFLQRDG